MNTRRCGLAHWCHRSILTLTAVIPFLIGGCINQPKWLSARDQNPIDRSLIEYPSGYVLTRVVDGLNCPTSICFDEQGSMIVAESGAEGCEPHIFGYRKDDHSYFQIYPYNRNVSFFPTGFRLYGPIGGIVAFHGGLYVTHRDADGWGVVSALAYNGAHTTIVGRLPARGDYGVTDIAIGPKGRLYFNVGTATNSGVVGPDNPWAQRYPGFHDFLYSPTDSSIQLRGQHFNSRNLYSGFLHPEIDVTAAFQALGESLQSKIRPSDKPNGAVYSCKPDGGDAEIWASGLGNVRGIAFDEYNHPFFSRDGMEVRGTRPVLNDPDAVVAGAKGVWYGWPDYSTIGHPITDQEYLPPLPLITPSGYDELSQLIDREASNLRLPDDFGGLVVGTLPSLSGAAKMTFVPSDGPFKTYRGSLIVALDGDRAPFATGGLKLLGPSGFKVAIVDVNAKQVHDFIRNTPGAPASQLPYGTLGLERPCDVKFGPDGSLYILDFGRMENDGPTPRYHPGTGQIFKLSPIPGQH
jgi:glucose/arabinose dehydrogenase